MVMLALGIAIGAAFSKFWILLYNMAKDKFNGISKSNDTL